MIDSTRRFFKNVEYCLVFKSKTVLGAVTQLMGKVTSSISNIPSTELSINARLEIYGETVFKFGKNLLSSFPN